MHFLFQLVCSSNLEFPFGSLQNNLYMLIFFTLCNIVIMPYLTSLIKVSFSSLNIFAIDTAC